MRHANAINLWENENVCVPAACMYNKNNTYAIRRSYNTRIEYAMVIKSETTTSFTMCWWTESRDSRDKISHQGLYTVYINVCFCESNGRQNQRSEKKLVFCDTMMRIRRVDAIFNLPCCSIRSLFGSVHEINATAYQSPVFGPSMVNRLIDPSDLNCRL